jgi:glycosyltransferase involved in cell wall biosynthesis
MAVFGDYVRRHKIPLVHSYDVPASMFTALAGRRFGLSGVISSQLSYRDLVSLRERALLRLVDRLSHRIVVNSKAVEQHLVDDYAIPREKIFLCYNGVDPVVFHGDRHVDPKPAALADASVVIGIVAALRPEKQIDTLMRAFSRVQPLRPGIKLAIVGSGPEGARLQDFAREIGIAGSTVFEPARSDVAGWMRAIDIFVQPSRSESFPNALVESMFCGCCAVGSAVGGIPEMIEHGRTGLLYRSGDIDELAAQLRPLIENDTLRQHLAAAGCEFAHRTFTIDIATRRTESLYEQLLGPDSAGRVNSVPLHTGAH